MESNTTEISGTTYEYHSENEGRKYGDIDDPTLREAVDYFHGDGRAGLQVERHTAFVSEGNFIHLHVLPRKDEQCPGDAHGCIMAWEVDEFDGMVDGLRVMTKGIKLESEPKKILETMNKYMDQHRTRNSGDSTTGETRVPRIERIKKR